MSYEYLILHIEMRLSLERECGRYIKWYLIHLHIIQNQLKKFCPEILDEVISLYIHIFLDPEFI